MSSIILDTNTWVQICDRLGRRGAREFYKHARSSGFEVVAIPPVVYELLALRDDERGRRTVEERAWILSRKWWSRRPSDAYLETEQLLQIIQRRRPEWLRADPDVAARDVLLNHWFRDMYYVRPGELQRLSAANEAASSKPKATNGFWTFEHLSGGFQNIMAVRSELDLDPDRVEVENRRKAFLHRYGERHSSEVERMWLTRSATSTWRIYTARTVWGLIEREANRPFGTTAYLDFLGPLVNFDRISRSSWESLWLDEVNETEASRFWLRGMAVDGQMLMGVSRGSVVDTQLPGFLLDATHFATADKNLVRLMRLITSFAPAGLRLAEPLLVKPTGDGLPQFRDLLASRAAPPPNSR